MKEPSPYPGRRERNAQLAQNVDHVMHTNGTPIRPGMIAHGDHAVKTTEMIMHQYHKKIDRKV